MKDIVVLEKRSSDCEDIYFLVFRNDIKRMELRDCYTGCGENKVGSYGAGDYSLSNESSCAEDDMKEEGVELFGDFFKDIEIEEDWHERNVYHILNAEEFDKFFDVEDLEAFINNWEKENANYTEVDAITYWNGHNMISKIVSSDWDWSDFEYVDKKTERHIIDAYNRALNSNNLKKVYGIERLYDGSKYQVDLMTCEQTFCIAEVTVK